MPSDEFIVLWDHPDDPDGNLREIAQRYNVSSHEVESVLSGSTDRDRPVPLPEGQGAVRARSGWTASGRYILVIYDTFEIRPGLEMIYPLCAYDADPPPLKGTGSTMENRP
jgi:hypothetical protein